jgi:ATP-dependent RNA helicase RhlE
MSFDDLKLSRPLLSAVKAKGYEVPTPIQRQAIPLVLAGQDVLACAQTGTGKTAAFALPILQLLAQAPAGAHAERPGTRPIRALVLTPTRELGSQIGQSFQDYGAELPLRSAVVFGGVHQHGQVRALNQGVDILVATPGRLLDLMNQGIARLERLEILVLDEADRMLDLGFITDVRRILKGIPKRHQTLFFSATMPPEIRALSEQMLAHPARIEVTPVASTVDRISQVIYEVQKRMKTPLLIRLLQDPAIARAIVFTRTKRDANRVCDSLNHERVAADAIHGDKTQPAREKALERFRRGECRVLVATDIAARGIDVEQVTHVFNHDIPNESESYVHRIGRTARAGAQGSAISFCAPEEAQYLRDIERLIRKRIRVVPTPDDLPVPPPKRAPRKPPEPGKLAVIARHPMRQGVVKREGAPAKGNPPPSPNNRKARRKAALLAKKSGLPQG